MDKEQIRVNLAGYRPELYRDDDPLIEESLKAAREDPELSAWLEEQINFDREFSERAAAAVPPPGNRETLLAACRQQSRPGAPPHRSRFRMTLAVAALLLISAAGLVKFFLFPAPVEFAETAKPTVETLREQMAYFASQRFVLDERFKTNALSAKWLGDEKYPTFEEIPGELLRYQGMGCKKIAWQGRKVSLICFRNQSNEIVHLFILEKGDLAVSPQADAELEQVLVRHERETVGWSDDDQVYLLVGSKPGVKVDNLLTIPM